RQQVEREREKLAVFEYGGTMRVAHQEWREYRIPAARALLDSTNPGLRGNWEWGYLNRILDTSLLVPRQRMNGGYSASWSPDGSRVLTGGNGMAWVWDAKAGAEVLSLRGHTFRVGAASWSPDGSRVVTGSHDGTARVWDVRTGAEVLTLKGHTSTVTAAS